MPVGRLVLAASTVFTGTMLVGVAAPETEPPAGVVGVAVFAPAPDVGVAVEPPVGVDVDGTVVAVGGTDVGVGGTVVAVFGGGVFVAPGGGVSVGAVTPGHVKLTLFEVFMVFSMRIVFASGGTFAVLKLNDTGLVVPAGKSVEAPGTMMNVALPGM